MRGEGRWFEVRDLAESLRLVVPGIFVSGLEALARALRRVVLGTLVDRHAGLDETREQLRTPIKAYTNGEQRERRTKPQAV